MDQIEYSSNPDIQQHMLLDMMKQHINNGSLPFQYSMNSHLDNDQLFQQTSDEDISVIQSSNVENDQDENEQIPMPIAYKKRARIKFNQEQLDVLEATFQQHRYPTVDIVDDLVDQLDLPTQKITVWFQNRRARLKKSQQKLDDQHSFEKDDQQQYDSGIHLDEDVSHDSPESPPVSSMIHLPPPAPFMTAPSPYYLPNSHHPFYNSMWQNFRYPLPTPTFQPPMAGATGLPYNMVNYNSSEIHSPFVFQDMINYQPHREFNGEL